MSEAYIDLSRFLLSKLRRGCWRRAARSGCYVSSTGDIPMLPPRQLIATNKIHLSSDNLPRKNSFYSFYQFNISDAKKL